MSLRDAARHAGKSESTVRNWCIEHNIGRRVGGGVWMVSRVALQMHLDGHREALSAYLRGDRSGPIVASYFRHLGLGALLNEFQAAFAPS